MSGAQLFGAAVSFLVLVIAAATGLLDRIIRALPLQQLPAFTSADFVAIALGVFGLYSAYMQHRNSAKATEVDMVKSTMTQQAALIKTLEKQLETERTLREKLQTEVDELRKERDDQRERRDQRAGDQQRRGQRP